MPPVTIRSGGGIHYAQLHRATSEYYTFWDSRFESTAVVGRRERERGGGVSVRFVAWNGESNDTA
jgi:hypothetical protein